MDTPTNMKPHCMGTPNEHGPVSSPPSPIWSLTVQEAPHSDPPPHPLYSTRVLWTDRQVDITTPHPPDCDR